MQAYSLDLRERIIDALRDGATLQQTADRFAVGLSTVKRYKTQHHATGTVAPKPWPGRARKIKDQDRQTLQTLVASRTNWTLAALCHAWHAEQGVHTTVSVLSDTLRRFKITHKKRADDLPSKIPRSEPPSENR